MKRTIIIIALLCIFFGMYGKDNSFELKPEVVTSVIQPGAPLKIKFGWKCPEGYTPKAWRLIAYVPNVPANFAEVTGSKIIPHKSKEWSTVFIMNWIWKIPADNILIKETEKWPAGDYKMDLYILFQAKDKNNKVQSKMIRENVLFSLKK